MGLPYSLHLRKRGLPVLVLHEEEDHGEVHRRYSAQLYPPSEN